MSTLIEYIKDKKNNRRGVLVATKETVGFSIGWSLCCKKDKFNREFGQDIAIGRAERNSRMKTPHSIHDKMVRFHNRAQRYFKVG